MAKQWGGRFSGKTDALVEQLGESVSFDARLAPWDIRGSIAHATMLGDQGIIAKKDSKAIVRGLRELAKDIAAGKVTFDPALEDVHTNIEVELVRRIGEAGKRLHTGRSRNDQIATDVRLWLRDQIDDARIAVTALQRALVEFGEAHRDAILPGCTHLQHAQPVLLAHHMLAYYEMLNRDYQRLGEIRSRVNVMPLGSAAMAGTPYPIDRLAVAKALEFESVSANSMDAVSDRDAFIEFCSAASLVMMHLSRLCEELILWSSPELAFVEIGDAFTTGSSIMPQKKNPDVAELVRGKTGRVYGNLMSLLTLLKGLPMTYNRDLQEDKEPLFDTADTLLLSLNVMARMFGDIRVNREALKAATAEGFLEATDMADYLVERGVAFREAHGVIGRIVRHAIKQKKTLPELSLATLQRFHPDFGDDIHRALTPEAIVGRRDNIGGTAPKRVKSALAKAKRDLDKR